MLRDGSAEEAGVHADARAKIHELCKAWAEHSGEPFVTLVAKRGVIVIHQAYGSDITGTNIDLDYRCWVAFKNPVGGASGRTAQPFNATCSLAGSSSAFLGRALHLSVNLKCYPKLDRSHFPWFRKISGVLC